jgi:uncharacterized membrane protein YgcG
MPAAAQKYCKINGAAFNYSEAYPVNIRFSTSAPVQCDFYACMNYTDTWPIDGQQVEWFRRDNTKVFSGVISLIEPVEMWEGGNKVYIHITCVGRDDRLYRRTTWNRNTFVTAQYKSYAGIVDTTSASHSVVTWVSVVVAGIETSNRFGPELAGKTIQVNGGSAVVLTVDSPEQMTLLTNVGAHSSVPYNFIIYSGDVVKDLLDDSAYPTGMLGGGFAEFEGFTWTGTSIQAGAAISNKGLLFDPPVTIHDAIQTLLDANPDFYFSVDVNQVAYFATRTLVAAPGNITPTSGVQKRNIRPGVTSEDVRNCEISITTFDAIDPISDTFVGDSSTRSWFTTKPMHEVTEVTLNGVPVKSTEGSGTSVADFYYTTNGQQFWQDHSAPVLTALDTVVISYKPLFADLIEYEDSAARAARAAIEGTGFGRYEQVIDRTNYGGKTDALAAATASVNRLKDNYYQLLIDTFEVDYQIGQSFTITEPNLQLSGLSVFIDEVSMTDQATKGTPYDWEYTLKCISVSRRITDAQVLRDAFSKSGGGGGSGGGSISGGGGGSTTTATAYLTDTTLVADATISQPASPVDGNAWMVIVRQNATGGWSVTWGTGIHLAPTIDSTINSRPLTMCVITFVASSGKWYVAGTPILGVKNV